jgi:hypothetical protein
LGNAFNFSIAHRKPAKLKKGRPRYVRKSRFRNVPTRKSDKNGFEGASLTESEKAFSPTLAQRILGDWRLPKDIGHLGSRKSRISMLGKWSAKVVGPDPHAAILPNHGIRAVWIN